MSLTAQIPMARNQTSQFPLRMIRTDSGIPASDVVMRGLELTPYFPRTVSHLYVLEMRGTYNYHILKALAQIYGKDIDDIARIADPVNVRVHKE